MCSCGSFQIHHDVFQDHCPCWLGPSTRMPARPTFSPRNPAAGSEILAACMPLTLGVHVGNFGHVLCLFQSYGHFDKGCSSSFRCCIHATNFQGLPFPTPIQVVHTQTMLARFPMNVAALLLAS